MEGLLLVYAVVVALELVLSLIMFGTLLMSIAPRRAGADDAVGAERVSARDAAAPDCRAETRSAPTMVGQARFPEDLDRALRLAFRELSRGSRDVALMVHTRALLERYRMEGAAGERG